MRLPEMRKLFLALALSLASFGAYAQSPVITGPQTGTLIDCSITVTNSVTQVVGAATLNIPRRKIILQNLSNSNAICFSFTTASPACGTPNSMTLSVSGSTGSIWQSPDAFTPQNALNAIAAGSSAGLTCWQY